MLLRSGHYGSIRLMNNMVPLFFSWLFFHRDVVDGKKGRCKIQMPKEWVMILYAALGW